ncbi:alpha/beta hydrolase [Agromyces laixinhei]|uniref:alpha/beta hydrolase n=1 Tax=Agromyces laixinhei TaxID=2585717 RepID=UPI0012EEACEA|nr:alpha/beta hydrolase [Agromyces laixinhei]
MHSPAPDLSPTNPPRKHRIVRAAVLSAIGLVLLAVAGFLIWANTGVMQAEPGILATVKSNPAISVVETGNAVVMAPTRAASGTGLVFIPGAKVDPHAYLSKLSGAVESAGLTVVITEPILNLAFFDQRPLSAFTDATDGIETWYVGGHSLGGVRACQYAEQPGVQGLVLFGSYCANDLSSTSLDVLSLSANNDGLTTSEDVRRSTHLLPSDTTFVEIEGANHARFGDYGLQSGDGSATISSEQVRCVITDELTRFLRE